MKTRSKANLYNSPEMDEILNAISSVQMHQTENRMLIAAKLSDAMEANGMRKKDLALKLGKRPSEVTRWLSGTHNFTIDTLSEIEELLGIQLLRLKDESKLVNYTVTIRMAKPKEKEHLDHEYAGNIFHEPVEVYLKSKPIKYSIISVKN